MLERRAVQPQLGLLKSPCCSSIPPSARGPMGRQLFRFRREAEEGRLRQRHRHRRPLHHRAQGHLGAGDARAEAGRGHSALARRARNAPPGNRRRRTARQSGRLGEGGASELRPAQFGFQEFTEFLNFAQDKLVVRIEADEEKGLTVFLGAEFYPPAPPPRAEEESFSAYDEKQPSCPVSLRSSSRIRLRHPPPPPAKRPRAPRKRVAATGNTDRPPRQPRRRRQEKSPRRTRRL